MKINNQLLVEMDACDEGLKWFTKQYKDQEIELSILAVDLIASDNENWLNWFITRKCTLENKRKYAIYAAELVLHIYENKYPNDDRPRKAIEVAKNYLVNPCVDAATYAAAYAAAYDAATAANATAYAAYATAYAATYACATTYATYAATYAATCAANTAAYACATTYATAAYAAAYSATAATATTYAAYAVAADAVANAARKETWKKILEYGLELINQKEKKQ